MLRSRCVLRIGVSYVEGTWIEGYTHKASAQAVASVEVEEAGRGIGPASAIPAVLDQILPRRRIASPHVSVGLAGAHVRAAIMQFAKLPRGAKDRSLLISQRFCREYRLDPAAFAVTGSALGQPESGGESVLCIAVSRTLLMEIDGALAARGLYPDEIAPDFMLRFAEADTREAEAPGMLLMTGAEGSTMLVWDTKRTVVHVSFFAAAQDGREAERRLASRIFRYATIVGHGGIPVAVYADGGDWETFTQMREQLGDKAKFLRWPAAGRS